MSQSHLSALALLLAAQQIVAKQRAYQLCIFAGVSYFVLAMALVQLEEPHPITILKAMTLILVGHSRPVLQQLRIDA